MSATRVLFSQNFEAFEQQKARAYFAGIARGRESRQPDILLRGFIWGVVATMATLFVVGMAGRI